MMKFRLMAGLGALTALVMAPAALKAQAAAETAVITAGTGAPQARSARSLGNAISGSMRRAAGALNTRSRASRSRPRAPSGEAASGHEVAADVDVLEGTDAPAYTLGNGARIRVSGGLRPASGTICTRHCPGAAKTQDEAVQGRPQEDKAPDPAASAKADDGAQ